MQSVDRPLGVGVRVWIRIRANVDRDKILSVKKSRASYWNGYA